MRVAYGEQEAEEPAAIESVSDPDSVLKLLPRDNAGYIDWVAAVRLGIVRPRATVGGGAGRSRQGFAFDFYFESDMPMFEAYFPHSAHVQWLDCNSCHPALYPYRGAEITMAQINAGESCGSCHGSVAFPADDCERCHLKVEMPADRVEAGFIGDVRLQRTMMDTTDVSATGAQFFPEAVFPHGSHRIRYQCSACHPGLYAAESGASSTTMKAMSDGDSCGSCHGESGPAFGLLQCDRCHVPKDE